MRYYNYNNNNNTVLYFIYYTIIKHTIKNTPYKHLSNTRLQFATK